MAKSFYKIVLVGNQEVGKSTWVRKCLTGKFITEYTPTMGVEVHPIKKNNVTFNIWDTAGQERYGGIRDGYYIQADACIVMYTVLNEKVKNWEKDFKRVCPNAPIIYVKTKVDNLDPLFSYSNPINISTKNNLNVLAPIDKLYELFNC